MSYNADKRKQRIWPNTDLQYHACIGTSINRESCFAVCVSRIIYHGTEGSSGRELYRNRIANITEL